MPALDCPFRMIDNIMKELKDVDYTIIDFQLRQPLKNKPSGIMWTDG
jgi:calcineurin-like phosphoesterase